MQRENGEMAAQQPAMRLETFRCYNQVRKKVLVLFREWEDSMVTEDCKRLTAAAFGDVEATPGGEFLGLPRDGEIMKLRHMDFWNLELGKIIENWVMIDILDFFNKSGVDLLDGNGKDDLCAGYKVAGDEKSDD